MRRVVANFRRQDWAAVLVGLVVVVLGVFLGVQASNWNEDREQDRRSAVFTERLKADPRAEAWNIEMQIGYHEQVQADARRAADALSGHAPLSDEALLVAAFRATQYNDNVRRRDRVLALALQAGNDRAAADAALRRMVEADGRVKEDAYAIAQAYALRGDADKAFEWLQRDWSRDGPGVRSVLSDPLMLRFRRDPRLEAYCRRAGLPSPAKSEALGIDQIRAMADGNG